MLIFTEWADLLEMAMVNKDRLAMDEADVKYLQQFPQEFWRSALYQRYSNLLVNALGPDGNLKPGWSDKQDITLASPRGKFTFRVNTGISRLVKKLQRQGYDTRDPDPDSQTLSGMKLMRPHQSFRQLNGWVGASAEAGEGNTGQRSFKAINVKDGQKVTFQSDNPNLSPGFAFWTPNKTEHGENSHDPGSDDERHLWAKLARPVQQEAERATERMLKVLENPDHVLHLNYYYWNERKDEVIRALVKRIKDNLADPEIELPAKRFKIMNSYITSIWASGHASRRALERAKEEGWNIGDMLKKGYSVNQLTNWLTARSKPGRAHPDRGAEPTDARFGKKSSGTKGTFTQQSPLVRGVEYETSNRANYGKNKLGNLRQAATKQRVATGQPVSPYPLSPQNQAQQPVRPRRAATNVDDQIGFKEWLVLRDKPKKFSQGGGN